MTRPTVERMAEALEILARHGRRRPKAFYLGPDDWTEFMATDAPTVRVLFGNNPPTWRDEPAFNGIPVRESKNVTPRKSSLYDHTGTGRPLPK